MRALAAKADIVVENFRPGTMEKWGLGYERARPRQPGAGHGAALGLRADRAVQATGRASARSASRWAACATSPAIPIARRCASGISIGDSLAAMFGVIGALMALHHRQRNAGAGQVVDVALYEAVFAMMEVDAARVRLRRLRARAQRARRCPASFLRTPIRAATASTS